MQVLALESSTSSAKALLYDSVRGVLAEKSCAYPPDICAGGISDTAAVTDLTLRLGAEVAQGHDVAAIALCETWHNLSLCAHSFRNPGKTISWNYLKPAEDCAAIRQNAALTDELYHRTGCMPHVTYPRQALRYFRAQGIALQNRQFISQGSYTFYCLTGACRASVSSMSGSGLLNIHTRNYDAFVLDWLELRAEQLPPLAYPRDTLPLSAAAAQQLGVAAGIPVLSPLPDGALNQFYACGAWKNHMTLSVGTSAAIRLSTDLPRLPSCHSLWCYYGVDSWISGAATAGACNCVNWFMERIFGKPGHFSELEQDAWQLENLPVFLPFLFGERCPGWNDRPRGGWSELRPEHRLSDLYHGLLAGICCNLYQCYQPLCALSGAPEAIHVSGGILHSPGWTQLLADLFQRPLLCANAPNASTLGAAMLALDILGEAPLHPAQKTERPLLPRPEQAHAAKTLFERYLLAYQQDLLREK